MRKKTDVVLITGDDTNVFSGRLGAEVPEWARSVRVQVVSSDYDWLHSLSMGGEEMARESGPHVVGADNLAEYDWTKPFAQKDVPRGRTDFVVLLNVNVVTAGTGLGIIEWSD